MQAGAVSVKCDIDKPNLKTGKPEFPYYSALLSQPNAGYMIDLLKTARQTDRKIRIFFSGSADKNPGGCNADDCRKMKGIGF